jgi:hypothetical protein
MMLFLDGVEARDDFPFSLFFGQLELNHLFILLFLNCFDILAQHFLVFWNLDYVYQFSDGVHYIKFDEGNDEGKQIELHKQNDTQANVQEDVAHDVYKKVVALVQQGLCVPTVLGKDYD